MITARRFLRRRFRFPGSGGSPPSPPVSSFTASDTTIFAGDSVTFTNTSTGSAITSHLWEVDDGGGYETFSTSEDAEYEFATAGSYSIRLTETNDGGSDQSDVTTITVEEVPSENDALLNVEFTNIYEGENLLVYNDSAVANAEEWSWEYREEPGGSWTEFSTSENPSTLSGLTEGTYSLRLTVTDDMDEDFISTRLNLVTVLPEIADGWYPEDDTATATDHDNIPNLVADSLVTVWADPGSQNLSDLTLSNGDILGIPYGSTVVVDEESTVELTGIGVAGTLTFSRSVDTEIKVQHLYVFAGGILDRGTERDPISGHTSIITILDVAIDKGSSPDALGEDPESFGNGIIACDGARYRSHGKTVTKPFIRLAAEPLTGHTTLSLSEAPTGWAIGDTIALPDTRQLNYSTWHDSAVHLFEERTITNISGTTITLNSALTWDHPCGRTFDGEVAYSTILERSDHWDGVPYMPHVANLTRTVKIRSEDGSGVRGHTIQTARADVDLRYTEFVELGRTTAADLHSTLIEYSSIFTVLNQDPVIVWTNAFNRDEIIGNEQVYITGSTGLTSVNGLWTATYLDLNKFSIPVAGNGTYTGGLKFTRLSTNQKGRYADHAHQAYGPIGGQSNGKSFTRIGCSYHDPYPAANAGTGWNAIPRSKWGMVVHGSSHGLIQRCIVHHYAGSGYMLEDGSEYRNHYDESMALNIAGPFQQRHGTAENSAPDTGVSGVGFMQVGLENQFTKCVAAGILCTTGGIVAGTGFYAFLPAGYVYNVHIPNFVGADPHEDGTTLNLKESQLCQLEDCETYGLIAAFMTAWNIGTDSGNKIDAAGESIMLNNRCWHNFETAWFGYPTHKWTIDGFEVLGDRAYESGGSGCYGASWGDYHCSSSTIKNFHFRNVVCAVGGCQAIEGELLIENGTVESFGGTGDTYLGGFIQYTPQAPGSGTAQRNHVTTIRNCVTSKLGTNPNYYDIRMYYLTSYIYTNVRVEDVVNVEQWQGDVDDNFRVYYLEQASDYEMPETGGIGGNILVGCPEAGLTNEEAYIKYHNDGTLKSPPGSLSDEEGCAIGGAVMPDDAETRAGIMNGKIVPV